MRKGQRISARLVGLALAGLIAVGGAPASAADAPSLIGWGSGFGPTPVALPGVTPVAIAAGDAHYLAVDADGTVWSWGDNQLGELGDGTFAPPEPINTRLHHVVGLTNAVAVAGGSYHSLALRADGTVWAWGSNLYGELGNAVTTNGNYVPGSTVPIQVSGLTSVVAIAAGAYTSFAVKADGTVWAWGFNGGGQLGLGTSGGTGDGQRTSPVRVPTLSAVTRIAARYSHTIVRKSDGSVWTWGANMYGELGNNSTQWSTAPIRVASLTDAVDVGAGYYHSLALRAGGGVLAWGRNNYGQLGDGTRLNRTTPVAVQGLGDAVTVTGGWSHSSAVRADGTVWNWGYGQAAGNGSYTDRSTPVQATGVIHATAVAGSTGTGIAVGQLPPPNVAPTIDAPPSAFGDEGTTLTVSGTYADANADQDVLISSSMGNITKTGTNTGTWTWSMPLVNGPQYYTVVVTANDGHGGSRQAYFFLRVDNRPPVITTVSGPSEPVATGVETEVTAFFSDGGITDTHTCIVDWGNGDLTQGLVSESNGSGTCTGRHAYAEAGVYTPTVSIWDDQAQADGTFQYVVAYDAGAGVVTGSGWIESPADACQSAAECQEAEGTGVFGFAARYVSGQQPAGTEGVFRFTVGSFDFTGVAEPVVVVADGKTVYHGTGNVNGQDGYTFVVTAWDGGAGPHADADRLLIQILNGDVVVYDNGTPHAAAHANLGVPPPAIGGGDIVIRRN